MIKTTLPHKSGNPEGLKNLSQQLESSSTNAHIVDKDLLRAFYKLIYLWQSKKFLSGKAGNVLTNKKIWVVEIHVKNSKIVCTYGRHYIIKFNLIRLIWLIFCIRFV